MIFDEFDPECMTESMFKIITDRHPYDVEVKGGTKRWNPKIITFTTNYDPHDWYGWHPAIARRIDNIVHFEAKL